MEVEMGKKRRVANCLIALAGLMLAMLPLTQSWAFSYDGLDWVIFSDEGLLYMSSAAGTLQIRPGLVTVQFGLSVDHESAVDVLDDMSGVEVIRYSKRNWYDLSLPTDNPTAHIDTLENYPGVVEVVPAFLVELSATPDEGSGEFTKQWYHFNNGQTGGTSDADIDATSAWETETGDTTVFVAILDSGANFNHADLKRSFWFNWDEGDSVDSDDDDGNGFDDDYMGWDFYDDDRDPSFGGGESSYHGNRVAGMVAAKTNNSVGIAGLAGGWGSDRTTGCKLMVLRIGLNDAFDATCVDDAVDYAVENGASIINMSFRSSTTLPGLDGAVEDAWDEDVFMVAASGNSTTLPVGYPAKIDEVMAVGGTNHNDGIWNKSITGPELNLCAPSGDYEILPPRDDLSQEIYTTTRVIYDYSVGTSFSAPQVCAAAALARSAVPSIGNEDLWRVLEFSTDDEAGGAANGWEEDYGWGRLNAGTLMTALDYWDNSSYTYSSSNCKVFCPGSDEDTFQITVTVKDGEDDPVEGVPTEHIWAESYFKSFKICCADADAPDCIISYSERVFADAATDSNGQTTISVTAGGGSHENTPVRTVRLYGLPVDGSGVLSLFPFLSYDMDSDCDVDQADSLYLAGLSARDSRGDFDCDGSIDQDDFDLLDSHRGDACPGRHEVSERSEAWQGHGEHLQAMPNPQGASSTMKYTVSVDEAHVEFSVFNVAGRFVRHLVSAVQDRGEYEVSWNGTNEEGNPVASGVYVLRGHIGSKPAEGKVVLIR
jgi:hypothetical protein